jgi:hypothetical protein
MTSIRRPFKFDGFTPYSLFVARALTSTEKHRNFNYIDFVAVVRQEEQRIPLFLAHAGRMFLHHLRLSR